MPDTETMPTFDVVVGAVHDFERWRMKLLPRVSPECPAW
jgi:hypothetical protein